MECQKFKALTCIVRISDYIFLETNLLTFRLSQHDAHEFEYELQRRAYKHGINSDLRRNGSIVVTKFTSHCGLLTGFFWVQADNFISLLWREVHTVDSRLSDN